MNKHLEELERLVAKELKHDLSRISSFEEFRNYSNPSIDCLRCAHGARILYEELQRINDTYQSYQGIRIKCLDKMVSLRQFPEINKYKIKALKEELNNIRAKYHTARQRAKKIPDLHKKLEGFLGVAVAFASNAYRKLVLAYAREKGMFPEEPALKEKSRPIRLSFNLSEDYEPIKPNLGKKNERELYERIKPKPGIFRRICSYLLRKF
jgi:hypothetical protein